ncbi:MAG: hypothetical protein AAGG48_22970 [Planctomycetota bacterium]
MNPFDPPYDNTTTETSMLFRLRMAVRILFGFLLFGPVLIAISVGVVSVVFHMIGRFF